MLNILLALQLILAVSLIVLVLMQRSEGGGLGIGGGGNSGKSASLGKLDGMQRATWALGAGFFACSIILAIAATRDTGSNSLIDQLEGVNASDLIQNETDPDADATPAPADPNAGSEAPVDPNAPADPNAQSSVEENAPTEGVTEEVVTETVETDPNAVEGEASEAEAPADPNSQ